MATLEVIPGYGIGFESDKVTLMTNWSTSDEVLMEYDASGAMLIPDLTGPSGPAAGSKADGITVISLDDDKTIQTNPEVVQYIFSICAYKPTKFPTVTAEGFNAADYQVDINTVKTVGDIRDEWNINMNNGLNINAMPYRLGVGNFLQFRFESRPGALPKWKYAMDNGNRYFDDHVLALFVITNAIHGGVSDKPSMYIKYLELKCLWLHDSIASNSDYVVGQTYSSGTP